MRDLKFAMLTSGFVKEGRKEGCGSVHVTIFGVCKKGCWDV